MQERGFRGQGVNIRERAMIVLDWLPIFTDLFLVAISHKRLFVIGHIALSDILRWILWANLVQRKWERIDDEPTWAQTFSSDLALGLFT